MDDQSDESLMGLVQNGDHQAFSVLVRRHSSKFFSAAYRYSAHVQEAEDVVQEAFIKLWRKPEAWDGERGAKFTTWFYKVVSNTALDHLRKKKNTVGSDVLEGMSDGAVGAEVAIQNKEREELIEDAIQSLPERQRMALNLCFYEELSNRQAAEIMDVKVKALESLLMRAKAGLRDILTRQGLLEVKNAG